MLVIWEQTVDSIEVYHLDNVNVILYLEAVKEIPYKLHYIYPLLLFC